MTEKDDYTKLFDPEDFVDERSDEEKKHPELGDRRDGKVYRYKPSIVLAVNVALATGRPLLVRGPSGSGKSSLAYNVARVLEREYYEFVITSRTQAQDLLWRFDAVRRLGDAQARQLVPALRMSRRKISPAKSLSSMSQTWHNYYRYIEPGIFWWVLDPQSARKRGFTGVVPGGEEARDPRVFKPDGEPKGDPVVLLDEIDKADPDFANNLLVPVGSLQFRVDEIRQTIMHNRPAQNETSPQANRPLIIITTNEERRLPQAFLRRCVALQLDGPGPEGLVEIASKIYGPENEPLYWDVVGQMTKMVRGRLGAGSGAFALTEEEEKIHLNVAQFLDAVQACTKLSGLKEKEALFNSLIEMTGWKESTSKA